MRRRSALRSQLLRALVVALGVPLGLLSAFELTLLLRFDRKAAEDRTEMVARRVVRETGAYLTEHVRAVESLADALEQQPLGSLETERVLQRFRDRHPGFLTMLQADDEGVIVAASPATDDAGVRHADRRRLVTDREYFRQPLLTGRPYVSRAFRGRGFGTDPIVAISARLRTAAGRGGVVEGSLDLRRLTAVLTPLGGIAGTTAVIADDAGAVVASSDPTVVPLEPLPDGKDGLLAARARLDGLGWTATAAVPWSAVHADRFQFLRATAVAAALALALGGWLAHRRAVWIASPLRGLLDSLRSYEAGGGLDLPRADGAPAEVAELIEGFGALGGRLNRAHDELRATLAGLEREIEARTRTLRESEERFRQLADNIEAVFWVRSLEPDRVLYVSPAYESIWERPRADLERDPSAFAAAIHPDDRERVLHAVALQPQGPYAQEYRIVCPTGEVKWIRTIAFPVVGREGTVIRIAGLSEETTQARRVDQLRQDLTQTMVHDLRSPLTAILAGIEFAVLPGVDRTAAGNALVLASRSAARLASLVDAILDVSRLESGQFPLELAPTDLSSLAREVVAAFAPLASTNQVAAEVSTRPVPDVPVDVALVRRVIENLVGNAIKFTPPGGTVRVTVTASAGAVRVSVADDGPGIEPDLASRLFQKFVSGRRPGRGSGLGLAFCRLVVEAHGGTIRLDTEPGHGATFGFAIPIAGPERTS